jgi:flagellar protein FliO/FliZ
MNTDTDLWVSFAQTFGMLFVVLALFLMAFYVFKRFSGATMGKGGRDLIKVLTVHHLSPKEKLILVSVLNETILLGVTPSRISQLAVLDHDPGLIADTQKVSGGFSDLLGKALKQKIKKAETLDGPDRQETGRQQDNE